MGTFIDHQGAFHNERRRNVQLRGIYEEANDRIAKLVPVSSGWVDRPADYLAQRVIHESYPHLSPQDVRTLVATIVRKYQAR